MNPSSRRHFLKRSAVGAAAVVASSQVIAQTYTASPKIVSEVETLQAKKIVASTADWNDGLAHSIPYKNPPAMGKERGLVLGGGGIVLISWYVGYFHALKEQGLDLSNANIAVGTSAGSIFASMILNGNLWRIRDEMDLFNDFPKVLAKLVPETKFNQSQIRAKEIGRNVKDASPASI